MWLTSQALSREHLKRAYGWAPDLRTPAPRSFSFESGHVATLGTPGCLAEASEEMSTLRFKGRSPKTHDLMMLAEMKAIDPAPSCERSPISSSANSSCSKAGLCLQPASPCDTEQPELPKSRRQQGPHARY